MSRKQISQIGREIFFAKNMSEALNRSAIENRGLVIPIGGGGGRRIFDRVAQEVELGTDIAVVTVNSQEELSSFSYNQNMFRRVGFRGEIRHLHSHMDPDQAQQMLKDNIGGIYIGGGDQGRGLPIMQRMGIDRVIVDLNNKGVLVAGTSAGCSEMAEVSPLHEESVPGLSVVSGSIMDQHFAQRVRYDRLNNLVLKQGLVGLGFDEDTAMVIDREGKGGIIGSGDVYLFRPPNGKLYEPAVFHSGESFDVQEVIEYTLYEASAHLRIAA